MARLGFKHTSEVTTRDKYTKVNFELGMTVDGREIPNAAVLGSALEEAVKLIQDRITESYQVVPVRNEPPANAVVTENPELRLAQDAELVKVIEPAVPAAPLGSGSGLGFPPSQ